MRETRNALWAAMVFYGLLWAVAHAQTLPMHSPCARTMQPKMGDPDLDAARCQIALDGQRMGELQSQITALTSQYSLAQQDVQRLTAEKAAIERELQNWKGYAKPLYEPGPAPAASNALPHSKPASP